ncbi:GNAT family N-acetyltransferase [Leisingera daeponensis]|uniref:GNAT family N-acetyltransferase n=1 Tax=Leisingera daeponensis TaxID=405746 RepID=UPI001C9709FC|nr:GNAT family N-acetyltransferase [Leisingera daeponensis]MBY6058088.1 GNAT family N-acetyltransferase [Leisingera daeponensis]
MNDGAALKAAAPEQLQTRILRRWKDVAQLEPEWRSMHERCRGRLYSSFDWLAAQHAGFGPAGDLRIITIFQAGRMVAAAPMCLVRKRFSKLLPFYRPRVLTGWMCKYAGFFEFLATSREALRALLGAVCRAAPRAGIELALFRVCTRDVLATRCLRLGGLELWQDRAQGSSIAENLTDWESYLQTRSRSFRKKVRVSNRQLQEAKAELDVFQSQDNAPVQRMLKLSQRSWKQKSGTGLAALLGGGAFLQELWRRLAARGCGSLVLLRAGEQDIASFCAVRCQSTWYGLFSEFDEAFSELSPGRCVMYRSLQAVIGQGQPVRFEFGRRTHYLRDFETGSYQVRRLRGVRRGGLAFWLLKLEDALRGLTGQRGLLANRRPRRADILADGKGRL